MRVVHCKRAPYTHYIGRPHRSIPREDWGKLGNPFPLYNEDHRVKVLVEFEHYARTTPSYLAAIDKLPEGAVLGCWCWPLPCHGEIIMEIWRERHADTV